MRRYLEVDVQLGQVDIKQGGGGEEEEEVTSLGRQ